MAGLYPLGALKGEIIDKTSARTALGHEQNGGRTAAEYSTPGVEELARHARRDTCSDDGGDSEARQAFRWSVKQGR